MIFPYLNPTIDGDQGMLGYHPMSMSIGIYGKARMIEDPLFMEIQNVTYPSMTNY